jgi:hypothetical protein
MRKKNDRTVVADDCYCCYFQAMNVAVVVVLA